MIRTAVLLFLSLNSAHFAFAAGIQGDEKQNLDLASGRILEMGAGDEFFPSSVGERILEWGAGDEIICVLFEDYCSYTGTWQSRTSSWMNHLQGD